MQKYWVEGLFVSQRELKKSKKSGKTAPKDIEPFAKSIWANSPEEAIQFATEELSGGMWIEGPKIGKTSEEQRMRASGAPELPGFAPQKKKK